MRERTLARTLRRAAQTFPAVVVTGPRQSGKTTLVKALFSKTHTYVTLEDPDTRIRAREDPRNFLDRVGPPMILDEIQYVPELLPYIKTRIDERRKAGQWIFTGSQNFVLMQGVSESLAGRAAILSLLPLSFAERMGLGGVSADPARWLNQDPDNPVPETPSLSLVPWLLRGGYPEVSLNARVDRSTWCSSYLSTYLERDVRKISNVGDLNQFERFLKLCAARTGQILNLSEMARDIGVSVPTAKRWLSVLEASYQVYLLHPYYRNIGKRLVKSPKLYFTDTALATYLLGLHQKEPLIHGPTFGALFETMVVADVLKRFLHHGAMPSMYSLRSRDGLEVDLVIEWGGKLYLFEIKSGATILPRHAAALERVLREFPARVKKATLVSTSRENFMLTRRVSHVSWPSLLGR